MPSFAQLTDEELQARLKSLQAQSASARELRSQRLQHELQVHQIELEMQNRALRQAQQELEIARDRYADLYDFAPVGYLTLDPKGCIAEINLTGAAMLGCERSRILGHPFAAWLPTGESGTFFDHLGKVLRSTEHDIVELSVKGRSGKLLTLRLESIAEPIRALGPARCRTVMTDITEDRLRERIEREREAELAHLARVSTLGAMASTIAHELNQPLGAIVAYAWAAAHSLKEGRDEPGRMLQALEQIISLGQRAGEIIRSINEFSSKGDALREPIDLNGAVNEAVRLVSTAIREEDVKIELALATELPRVNGNGVQLEQVIVNLLMNAIEALAGRRAAERRVTISTSRMGNAVRVDVRDTGGALSPETIEHMFEPFFSTKSGGHGIGLALSRTIVVSHGGRIWATANETGGATVSFQLPAHREETVSGAPADLTAK